MPPPPLLLLLLPPLLRLGSRRRLLPVMSAAAAAASSAAGPERPYEPGSLSAAFVTCPSEGAAKELARSLVERRLAACVNLLPRVTSIYEWKGQIEEDAEVLLMIKTRSSRVPALAEFVRSVHPYEVAEVIAVPIQQGNPPYLQWVLEAVPEPE
ncbi:protein CutA [Eublepharis macularius]|uniref:Protein CutA n=1 Tax=Eublepharis macularius TaxID=481883 RepID=A0AA97KVZ7_EUBMA|nr:protein CutA [Eublepharis macularius]